jgi:stress response protein YsnF
VARADIYRHAVSVEHVPINREIDEIPAPWEDGDVLVIPVVEEILVVEKRLILKEELRVRRRREVDHVEQPVTLRAMEAIVERHAINQGSTSPSSPAERKL